MDHNLQYPKGSEWRKWDLHIHSDSGSPEQIVEKILKEEISVFSITDHCCVNRIDNYLEMVSKKQKEDKEIHFLPGVELRTDKGKKSVHIIGIFPLRDLTGDEINSDYLKQNLLSKIDCSDSDIKKAGKEVLGEGKNEQQYLKSGYTEISVNFEKAAKQIRELGGIVIVHAGTKSSGIETEMDHSNSHKKYEILNSLGHTKRKLMKENILVCELPNWNASNLKERDFYLKTFNKPSIVCSDSHKISVIGTKFTWIKADPTFEGLKQLIYEPEPGERAWIGPVKPDRKDDYKIIKKIKFKGTNDFPEEIEFNDNLSSIIGSRSSGKSALLAYVAHSINKELTEELMDGPGEGKKYHWDNINLEYSIEWKNGKDSCESQGRIVYIPQNHLFEKSKDPDEIKKRIEPVLFKILPDFALKYKQTENIINNQNKQIFGQIENWFNLSYLIRSLESKLKDFGDKKSIKKERQDIKSKIEKLKVKYKLSEEELKTYQTIRAEASSFISRIKEIKAELLQISDITDEQHYFSILEFNLAPAIEGLPKQLQDKIRIKLREREKNILVEINKQVIGYKSLIKKNKITLEEKIRKIKEENNELIEKYKKNIELEEHVKKLNEYDEIIKNIVTKTSDKKETQEKLQKCEKNIKSVINQRKSFIEQLKIELDISDQRMLGSIKFGLEYGYDEKLDVVSQKINLRDKTEFVGKNILKIDKIRAKPAEFLLDVYSGRQKINTGNDIKDVSQEVLTLTEKILFTAKMENDKIGGFFEPTMTPGKRALFALKLILYESEDTWPLLIDQPEDDLDSRSIYDDIVPFLKKKKKERQIIMVSHNANLVIGSDSEQIIVANRKGTDRKNADGKQFNYFSGSIEYSKEKDSACEDTLKSQGIREHACLILEGGKIAFEKRRNKYNLRP